MRPAQIDYWACVLALVENIGKAQGLYKYCGKRCIADQGRKVHSAFRCASWACTADVAKACSRNSTRSAMYWRPPSSITLANAVGFWNSLALSTPHTQTTNLSTHPFRRSGPFVSGRRLMLIGRSGNRRRASGVEPRENENGRRDPGNQQNRRD